MEAPTPPSVEELDGEITRDADGYRIIFERLVPHRTEAVFAALTQPRRLALWEHPVEYYPDLREGATIFAHLNPQVGAFALGVITQLEPPHHFAFRWTTNHRMLPPDFTMSFAVSAAGEGASTVRLVVGPFGEGYQIVALMASIHIHLDHLEEAVVAEEGDLPVEPWPPVSVVTRDGRMRPMAMLYDDKIRPAHPDLPPLHRG